MKRVKGVMLAVGITGLALGGSAVAQPSAIPPDVAERVRALGPVLNDELRASARSAYAPLQPKIGPEILVKADISYGPDERHKLDVFAPAHKPTHPAPVVIFFMAAPMSEATRRRRAHHSMGTSPPSGFAMAVSA
jgi:hypothetical protein